MKEMKHLWSTFKFDKIVPNKVKLNITQGRYNNIMCKGIHPDFYKTRKKQLV